MGGTNDMPDREGVPTTWGGLAAGLARRGLLLARDVLADVVAGVDGHDGARRNAARAVTSDVARARERAEATTALARLPPRRSPAA